jgi:hypothetical protein
MAKNLTICNDGHKEICYQHGECPLCKCIADKEGLEYEIGELKDVIDGLEREIGNLQ